MLHRQLTILAKETPRRLRLQISSSKQHVDVLELAQDIPRTGIDRALTSLLGPQCFLLLLRTPAALAQAPVDVTVTFPLRAAVSLTEPPQQPQASAAG